MFESLSERLQGIFRKLGARGKLTESNITEGLREVRVALLEADVNYKVVKDFIDKVTKRAVGQEVIRSITPSQQIIKIVSDELTALMGPVDHSIAFNTNNAPTVFMMVGLQGSGKTTSCAKFAKYLMKKYNRRPLLVAADIQRPAAIEQLKVLGKQLDIPVFTKAGLQPPQICHESIKFAEQNMRDTIILDTAGRLHVNQELMDELRDIKRRAAPQHIFLVSDAMTGQDAVNSAKEFNSAMDITGVIMTKLDGDARGGAAMSIKAITGKPIKFTGVGEKTENFEEFHPDRMASRILGMGDVVSLVERVQQNITSEEADALQQKMKKKELNFQDFLEQLQKMKKMGPFKELLGMIPGLGGMADNVDEKEFKRFEAIILSMTKEEREHPELLDGGRRKRIATGSGSSIQAVNTLLKNFRDMKKMMSDLTKGKMGKLGKMGFGKMPFNQ